MTARLESVAPSSLPSFHPYSEPSRADLPAGDVSQGHGIQLASKLPAIIEGPSSWASIDGQSDLHIVELDHDEVAEVDAALELFKELDMNGDEVNRERFPLPTLGEKLDRCAVEVHFGTGMCMIRGIDPGNYSIEDNMIIFLGISSYIGDQRGLQSSKGAMLSHVTESKRWTVPRTRRHGIHTNSQLPFHTDMGTDILAMHVRDCARVGGRTCLSPVAGVYNDIIASNPLVLDILAKPNWPIRTSPKRCSLSPLITFHQGNLVISMDPARIGPHAADRHGLIPSLTLEQQAALAVLQNTARERQLELDNSPGDMIYLNNWSLLHAREAYQDGESSARHLVRLWLRNTALAWPIPDSVRGPWDCAFGDKASKVQNHSYPIMPMPDYMESKYTNGTAAFVQEDGDDEDEGESEEEGANKDSEKDSVLV